MPAPQQPTTSTGDRSPTTLTARQQHTPQKEPGARDRPAHHSQASEERIKWLAGWLVTGSLRCGSSHSYYTPRVTTKALREPRQDEGVLLGLGKAF